MLELPEVMTLAGQITSALKGKIVKQVYPPTKEHKFCWFYGNPQDYDMALKGASIVRAEGFGMFMDIVFDNGLRLSLDDGASPRLSPPVKEQKNYQLKIEFDDSTALVFTVAMYGGIQLHGDQFDNCYYSLSRESLSPVSDGFDRVFYEKLSSAKPALSAKAFLATEQRFPGVGNGTCQDILFDAGINPKTKISLLSGDDTQRLLNSMVSVLGEMIRLGGRDTEKDLFGAAGGYRTKLSRSTIGQGCPRCGGNIVKEAYLGGSVYYCPHCQPLLKP